MVTIRSATVHDLPGAYRVCLLTGDSGRDASATFRNPELLGHVFVGPYIVGEPALATMVSDDDGVAGYLLAAADTRAFADWAEATWWPPLRERYPLRTDGSAEAGLVALIHEPPAVSDSVILDYPSHLHIDLLDRVRGRGLGRRLIEDLLDRLRACGSPGVHLDVARDNSNAIAFYRHLGFHDLELTPDSAVMGIRLRD